MLITGKIKEIEKNSDKDIYTVILEKTRKEKKILIPIIFWGHLSKDANPLSNKMTIGQRIDIQVYCYGKPIIASGKRFWNAYIVAESWRPYIKGSKRYRKIVNKDTGEIIKRKDELPKEYDKI
jgi:hypothetical protein